MHASCQLPQQKGSRFLRRYRTQQIIAVAKNVASIRADYTQRAAVMACIKAAKDNVGQLPVRVTSGT